MTSLQRLLHILPEQFALPFFHLHTHSTSISFCLRNSFTRVQVFGEYLRKLEKKKNKSQRRRILLFMDNAPSHKICGAAKEEIDGFEVFRLQHVTNLFLPANTSSVINHLTLA